MLRSCLFIFGMFCSGIYAPNQALKEIAECNWVRFHDENGRKKTRVEDIKDPEQRKKIAEWANMFATYEIYDIREDNFLNPNVVTNHFQDAFYFIVRSLDARNCSYAFKEIKECGWLVTVVGRDNSIKLNWANINDIKDPEQRKKIVHWANISFRCSCKCGFIECYHKDGSHLFNIKEADLNPDVVTENFKNVFDFVVKHAEELQEDINEKNSLETLEPDYQSAVFEFGEEESAFQKLFFKR